MKQNIAKIVFTSIFLAVQFLALGVGLANAQTSCNITGLTWATGDTNNAPVSNIVVGQTYHLIATWNNCAGTNAYISIGDSTVGGIVQTDPVANITSCSNSACSEQHYDTFTPSKPDNYYFKASAASTAATGGSGASTQSQTLQAQSSSSSSAQTNPGGYADGLHCAYDPECLHNNCDPITGTCQPNSTTNTGTTNTTNTTQTTAGAGSNPPAAGVTVPLFNPLPEQDLTHVFLLITQGLLAILGIFAVVFIIVGGVEMVVAAGNEEALAKAKKTIVWAVLGLVVALMSFSIIAIVEDLLQANIPAASAPANNTPTTNAPANNTPPTSAPGN